MKNNLFIIGIVLFFCVACGTSKKNQQDDVMTSVSKDQIKVSTSNKNSDSLFAYIERTPCLGKCPIYSMTIYKSGYAIYNGKNFVEEKGIFEGYISPKIRKEIKRIAKEIQYFEMKSIYTDTLIMDLPTTYTQLHFEGQNKKIIAKAHVPTPLLHFQKYLDGIVQKTVWEPLKK